MLADPAVAAGGGGIVGSLLTFAGLFLKTFFQQKRNGYPNGSGLQRVIDLMGQQTGTLDEIKNDNRRLIETLIRIQAREEVRDELLRATCSAAQSAATAASAAAKSAERAAHAARAGQ